MNAIVTDYRILNALARRGLIETRDGRERHWTGTTIRNYFVRCGPKLADWYQPFDYKGKTYRIEYFVGCFHPFVVRLGVPKPAFV